MPIDEKIFHAIPALWLYFRQLNSSYTVTEGRAYPNKERPEGFRTARNALRAHGGSVPIRWRRLFGPTSGLEHSA
jgi:hypothetical protein